MIEMRQKKTLGKMHISELWNRDLFTKVKNATKLREIKNFKHFTQIYNKEITKMIEKVKETKKLEENSKDDATLIIEEIFRNDDHDDKG